MSILPEGGTSWARDGPSWLGQVRVWRSSGGGSATAATVAGKAAGGHSVSCGGDGATLLRTAEEEEREQRYNSSGSLSFARWCQWRPCFGARVQCKGRGRRSEGGLASTSRGHMDMEQSQRRMQQGRGRSSGGGRARRPCTAATRCFVEHLAGSDVGKVGRVLGQI